MVVVRPAGRSLVEVAAEKAHTVPLGQRMDKAFGGQANHPLVDPVVERT